MLDREFMDVHYLRVVAAVEGQPQLSATTTVQVRSSQQQHAGPGVHGCPLPPGSGRCGEPATAITISNNNSSGKT